MAEALLGHWGGRRFTAFSAGSFPRGEVHPLAIEVLQKHKLPVAGLRSKSWDELAGPGAPDLHFVFTVCDQAAKEICPVWPGQPVTAHWGVEDPAAVEGTPAEQRRAFLRTFRELDARVKLFTSLRLEELDRLTLQKQLEAIGRTRAQPHENPVES